MPLAIGTNSAAINAAASTASVQREIEISISRLSSGRRINAASDDAAGVAISSRLNSSISALKQSLRNAADFGGLLDTAEISIKEIEKRLHRIRELSVQAANDTNSQQDRANLDIQAQSLLEDINGTAALSNWAGQSLLDGSFSYKTLQFSAAGGASDSLHITIPNVTTNGIGILAKPPEAAGAPAVMEMADSGFDVESTDWGLLFTGDFVKFGIDKNGTLGNGSTYGHGIVYDGSGERNFDNSTDYIVPGSPYEGFVVNNGDTKIVDNNNNNFGGATIKNGTLTDMSGVEYDGEIFDARAVWVGETADLRITHDFYVGTNHKDIYIKTTLEALNTVDDIYYLRTVDPDVNKSPGDGFNTINSDIETDELDYVVSEGLESGYAMGMVTDEPNTEARVSRYWTRDAKQFYTSTDTNNFIEGYIVSDSALGLVNDVGTLSAGSQKSLTYTYFFNDNLETAVAAAEEYEPFETPEPNVDLTSQFSSLNTISVLDHALKSISNHRVSLGALSNRLHHVINANTSLATNLSSSKGRINDTDFALETTNLAKNQILQQASTAMLAQANASKMNVLSLL